MTSGWTEVSVSIRATADGSWSIVSTSEGRAWMSTLVWNVEVRTFQRGGKPGRRTPESSAGHLLLVQDDGGEWSGSDHLWRSGSTRTCR